MQQDEKAKTEAASEAALKEEIKQEQQGLESALRQEQRKWNNSTQRENGPAFVPGSNSGTAASPGAQTAREGE